MCDRYVRKKWCNAVTLLNAFKSLAAGFCIILYNSGYHTCYFQNKVYWNTWAWKIKKHELPNYFSQLNINSESKITPRYVGINWNLTTLGTHTGGKFPSAASTGVTRCNAECFYGARLQDVQVGIIHIAMEMNRISVYTLPQGWQKYGEQERTKIHQFFKDLIIIQKMNEWLETAVFHENGSF